MASLLFGSVRAHFLGEKKHTFTCSGPGPARRLCHLRQSTGDDRCLHRQCRRPSDADDGVRQRHGGQRDDLGDAESAFLSLARDGLSSLRGCPPKPTSPMQCHATTSAGQTRRDGLESTAHRRDPGDLCPGGDRHRVRHHRRSRRAAEHRAGLQLLSRRGVGSRCARRFRSAPRHRLVTSFQPVASPNGELQHCYHTTEKKGPS